MKYIQKGEAPRSLEEYKTTEGASFKDLDKNHTSIKREIKNSLIAEQGGDLLLLRDQNRPNEFGD